MGGAEILYHLSFDIHELGSWCETIGMELLALGSKYGALLSVELSVPGSWHEAIGVSLYV